MFDGDINPLRRWGLWLLAMGLLAFLGLFQRWLKWPKCPDEVVGRASRVFLFGAIIFLAAITGIVSVNHWLIHQPTWQDWTHDSEVFIPLAMLVIFIISFLVLAFGVEQVLRLMHSRYRTYVEELNYW